VNIGSFLCVAPSLKVWLLVLKKDVSRGGGRRGNHVGNRAGKAKKARHPSGIRVDLISTGSGIVGGFPSGGAKTEVGRKPAKYRKERGRGNFEGEAH